MVAKPLPNFRKPTSTAAAAFVEADSSPQPEPAQVAAPKKGKTASATGQAPAGDRRRMTVYISKANARALKLQAIDLERDMSEIVDDLLTKHLKQR